MKRWPTTALLAMTVTGCAHTPAAPVSSEELQKAIAVPRTWNDTSPLHVRDVNGRPVDLQLDDPVMASAPEDGAIRQLALRDLLASCETPPGAGLPLYGPPLPSGCWLRRRAFSVLPRRMPDPARVEGPAPPTPSPPFPLAAVVGGTLLVGGIVGATACAFECPKPWSTIVPVTGLGLVGLGLAAIVLVSSSHVRF